MVNYRSVTIEIEGKDWCSRIELAVYIEIVVSRPHHFVILNATACWHQTLRTRLQE